MPDVPLFKERKELHGIIVHTIDDVRAALQADPSACLQSAPDAIFYAGGLYLLTMFRQAKAEFPGSDAIFILDCADASAEALAAMRMGHSHIRSAATEPLRAKLSDIAQQSGVVFL